jgi:hypothetical protein
MAYIKIDPILDDWIEDKELTQENISKSKLKRWALDIIKDYTTIDMWKHYIALINVKNTKAQLPDNAKQIISIGYRIFEDRKDCTTIKEISEYTQTGLDGCDLEIKVKCQKCAKDKCSCNSSVVEVDIDRIQMMQNPWYYDASRFAKPYNSEDLYHDGKNDTKGKFKLMAYATNPFHNVNNHIPDCVNLKCESDYRYVFHDDTNTIETNITEPNAELLVAYKGTRLTEDGDFLIPDNTNAIEAIEYQLTYKYFSNKFTVSEKPAHRTAYMEAMQKRDLAVIRLQTELGIKSPNEIRAELSQIMNRPKQGTPTRTYNDQRTTRY